MDETKALRWWREKGVYIVNERTIDLIGQNIGYVPLENLFTREELRQIGKANLFTLIDEMCDDGMKVKELIYRDGSRELLFFID